MMAGPTLLDEIIKALIRARAPEARLEVEVILPQKFRRTRPIEVRAKKAKKAKEPAKEPAKKPAKEPAKAKKAEKTKEPTTKAKKVREPAPVIKAKRIEIAPKVVKAPPRRYPRVFDLTPKGTLQEVLTQPPRRTTPAAPPHTPPRRARRPAWEVAQLLGLGVYDLWMATDPEPTRRWNGARFRAPPRYPEPALDHRRHHPGYLGRSPTGWAEFIVIPEADGVPYSGVWFPVSRGHRIPPKPGCP